jgi:hypothetical protein
VGSLRRSAGFGAFGGFLRQLIYLVFCGVSAFGSGGCTISHLLVLLYIIYPALLSARCMLALTSATPGMPYAAVRALEISTPGRSLSRVIPAVPNVRGVRIEVALHTHVRSPVALRKHVRSQVALRARVPAPPTGCTRPTQASVGTGFFFPDGLAVGMGWGPNGVGLWTVVLTGVWNGAR